MASNLVSSAILRSRIDSKKVLASLLRRNYAVAVGKKIVGLNPEDFQVEEDAEKLCKYACINYLVDPKDKINHGPKILPESEYPEWLFKLDLELGKELEDMDPATDGPKYWDEWRRRKIQQEKRYLELKFKDLHLQTCPTWDKHAIYSRWRYTEQ